MITYPIYMNIWDHIVLRMGRRWDLASFIKYNPTKINGTFKSHDSFLTDPSQPIYECSISVELICNGCEPNATDKVTDKNIKWKLYFFKIRRASNI